VISAILLLKKEYIRHSSQFIPLELVVMQFSLNLFKPQLLQRHLQRQLQRLRRRSRKDGGLAGSIDCSIEEDLGGDVQELQLAIVGSDCQVVPMMGAGLVVG